MKKVNSTAEYIIWLFKQYQEIKQSYLNAIYRIIEIKNEHTDKPELIIQVCGKNATLKILPQEILADDGLLEGFSKKDVCTITYLACNSTKPKAKIVLQEFCEKLNKIVFGIKRPGEELILKKTAQEISLDKSILKNLPPDQAHMIGYITADDLNHERKIK